MQPQGTAARTQRLRTNTPETMKTRTRQRTYQDEEFDDSISDDILFAQADLDDITDDDIEEFLSEQEGEKEPSFWNLPTITGLSIITVGIGYLLQEMGLAFPFDFGSVVGLMPWLAGVLIILLGFGVLNWKPNKKRKAKKLEKRLAKKATEAKKQVKVEEYQVKPERSRKLRKSRDRKIAGVAGGLANYFGVDPTLVRIAFVVATVFGGGFPAIPLYIILSLAMAKPEPRTRKPEGRITIIREG